MKRATTALALFFLPLILVSAGSVVEAATWYVDVGGSGDFLTIQEGINASSDSDTVIVAAGTYSLMGNHQIRFYVYLIS